MDFFLKSGDINKQKADLLILTTHKKKLSDTAKSVDKELDGLLSHIFKRDSFNDLGEGLSFPYAQKSTLKQICLLSTGEKEEISTKEYAKLAKAIAKKLQHINIKTATIYVEDIQVADQDTAWKVRQLTESIVHAFYQFDQFKSKKKPAPSLKSVTFLLNATPTKAIKNAVQEGQSIAIGRNVTRTLGDMPANVCTPTYLGEQAKELAKNNANLTTKVLGEKDMAKLGMNTLLSVGHGSVQESKLILMEYNGSSKKSDKPIVLLGKGITFDSGGISLKPGAGMDEMKYDMCGAATIFGVINTIVTLNLPINVVGMVASAENMPSSKATKPGDIITSMSGQTVEILNTDAEGRLVLCDALTYAERYKPKAVIDVATLTGACIVALGHHNTAVLSNNDELSEQLLSASNQANDTAWRLPIGEEYDEQLKSNFADVANIGGKGGGTITAACFLARFAKAYPWAHLDIAGTAWTSGAQKGATGRPVALLVQYLLNQL